MKGFLRWALVGLLLGFSVLLFPVGLLLFVAVPFALIWAIRAGPVPRFPATLVGLAFPILMVAFFNRNSNPCDQAVETSPCGGVDAGPFLVAGLIALVVGMAGFFILSMSTRGRRGGGA